MKFTLEIELGNDAMQIGADIEDALRELVKRRTISNEYDPADRRVGANEGRIRDGNGNTVGKWEVTE